MPKLIHTPEAPLLSLHAAADCLRTGGVIAYPTEGVFGLGCDPFNPQAVLRLLKLKQRSPQHGLILVAAGLKDLLSLIDDPSDPLALQAFSKWPAPISYLFPASAQVPDLIRGQHSTVALRVTAHPLANHLCRLFGKPLVSTSANSSGLSAALDVATVQSAFGDKIDGIVPGELMQPGQPSRILRLDGQTVRS